MTEQTEVTLYEHETIKITNSRAIIGNATYAISNISSVRMDQPAKGCLPIIAIVIGVSLILAGISGDTGPSGEFIILGGLLAVGGFLVYRSSKNMYRVKIASTGGERSIMTSPNRDEIEKIIEAINRAIASRK